MRVLCVVGTRPEAIKLAPVILKLRSATGQVASRVCVTGQHRELVDEVFACFGLRADYDLNVMRRSQSPSDVASRVLRELDSLMAIEQPDWVIVHGDTTSTMAGALAGLYGGARIAHVEAGLRTGDLRQPFPEEANRRIVGSIASLHFAPTHGASDNLRREGVPGERIVVTGNTVVDAMRLVLGSVQEHLVGEQQENLRTLLVTMHRRENHGAVQNVCEAIKQIACTYAGRIRVVWPVHPSPHVQPVVARMLAGVPGVDIVPPMNYMSFLTLLNRSFLVLTDSGGIQEEAPCLRKPVLVLRSVTERPEVLDAGCGFLVGTDAEEIVATTRSLLDSEELYLRASRGADVFGDGRASQRIVTTLLATRLAQPMAARVHA